MRLIKYLIIFIIIFLCTFSAYSECILIISKEGSLSKINSLELKRLFSGKTKTLSGVKVSFVLQKKNNQIHNEFLKTYLKKSTQQFSKTWKKLIFTGKAKSPKSLNSDKDVVEFLKQNKNFIGYIDSENFTDAVKKIEVH
jgi:hypothetical protein